MPDHNDSLAASEARGAPQATCENQRVYILGIVSGSCRPVNIHSRIAQLRTYVLVGEV